MHDLIDDQSRTKVWELIKDIRIAQLVTHSGDGLLNARPMAAMNTEFSGALWFFTTADAPKIIDISGNPYVLLLYSDPSSQSYVSVQGTAHVLNDRNKINMLWSEAARIWFPQGKEDPSIRLIRIDVTRAEYWDSPASKLVMVYGYVKARITGEVQKIGEHKRVAF